MELRKLLTLLCAVGLMGGTVMAGDSPLQTEPVPVLTTDDNTDRDISALSQAKGSSEEPHSDDDTALGGEDGPKARGGNRSLLTGFADFLTKNRFYTAESKEQDLFPDKRSYWGQHFRKYPNGSWFRIEDLYPDDDDVVEKPKWHQHYLAGRVPASVSALGRAANAGTWGHSMIKDNHDTRLWSMIAKLFKKRDGYSKLMGNSRGMSWARRGLSTLEALLIELMLARAVNAQTIPGAILEGGQAGWGNTVGKWGTKNRSRAGDSLPSAWTGDSLPSAWTGDSLPSAWTGASAGAGAGAGGGAVSWQSSTTDRV